MAVVAMVLAVAHTPAMVRHQDGSMSNVAYQIVQVAVVAEALVATVATQFTRARGVSLHRDLYQLQGSGGLEN